MIPLLRRLTNPARPVVAATPADEVHQENRWRLLRYRARPQGLAFRTPVLMVPSLINRHYVLDLAPGRSFVEYLVGRGHDVWMIDWGTPGDEDRYVTLDDVIDREIGRATRLAAKSTPRGKAHVLGYCLGGTLAAAHVALRPERVASLTALAAPVRFAQGGLLAAWCRARSFDVNALVDATGNVPWPLMQAAFHLLRPTLAMSKAVHVVDRASDDEFLDGFFALETWGNDNVAFPGECYRAWAEQLYRADALAEGTLRISGRPARLQDIACPLLAVTFEHDNIVPKESAGALMDLVASQDKQRLHLPGGHVGAVVARNAAKRLWPVMSEWWAARD